MGNWKWLFVVVVVFDTLLLPMDEIDSLREYFVIFQSSSSSILNYNNKQIAKKIKTKFYMYLCSSSNIDRISYDSYVINMIIWINHLMTRTRIFLVSIAKKIKNQKQQQMMMTTTDDDILSFWCKYCCVAIYLFYFLWKYKKTATW